MKRGLVGEMKERWWMTVETRGSRVWERRGEEVVVDEEEEQESRTREVYMHTAALWAEATWRRLSRSRWGEVFWRAVDQARGLKDWAAVRRDVA